MLNTFDENNNEMLLAAIQELTANLATAQGKIAELEKGGGGNNMAYVETAELDAGDFLKKVTNINELDFTKPITFVNLVSGGLSNSLIYYIANLTSAPFSVDISALGLNSYINDQNQWATINGTKNVVVLDILKIKRVLSQINLTSFEGFNSDIDGFILDTETGYFLYNHSE